VPTGNLLQFLAFLSVTPGWRGFVSASRLLWSAPDLASLAHEFGSGRPPQWPMVFGDTGEMAMDYEWLWVVLAVGVLAPVGVVPFGLARDACCWWREHRRERREREMAGGGYERDIVRE
jgi:hypothetical protein